MARHESDREELLREATALVERIELAPRTAPHGEHVTAGFRAGGAASIFFGADPVYQFNANGEFRRAHCDGLLFKADRGRLVSLRRVRQQDEVQLLRHDLTDAEQVAFLSRMSNDLWQLATGLQRQHYRLVGQVPADVDVLGRLQEWLARHEGVKVAAKPHVEAPRKRRRE